MSTPGRAYALRRLAAARRSNRNAMAAGRRPKLGGKTVSAATFTRRTGVTKAGARKRQKAAPRTKGHGGRFGQYSNAQLSKMARQRSTRLGGRVRPARTTTRTTTRTSRSGGGRRTTRAA